MAAIKKRSTSILLGILGTLLVLDSQSKVIVVLLLGWTSNMEASVRLLIDAVGVLKRVKT
jgi:hypothetical protein